MPPLEDIRDISIIKEKNDGDEAQSEISFKEVFKYLLIHKNLKECCLMLRKINFLEFLF